MWNGSWFRSWFGAWLGTEEQEQPELPTIAMTASFSTAPVITGVVSMAARLDATFSAEVLFGGTYSQERQP